MLTFYLQLSTNDGAIVLAIKELVLAAREVSENPSRQDVGYTYPYNVGRDSLLILSSTASTSARSVLGSMGRDPYYTRPYPVPPPIYFKEEGGAAKEK